jgi:hypothetical protein
MMRDQYSGIPPMSVKDRIKTATKRALASADLSMMTTAKLESIQQRALIGDKAQLLALFADADIRKSLDLLVDSRSQLNQDLFVLSTLGWKRDGYYVEFGATDGETLSNTWLLDKRFGWRGILAEPARIWRNALECAGRNATLEFECVWSESGQTLEF